MFLREEDMIFPNQFKSPISPKTPKHINNEFGYSQSPSARIEILKLREQLDKCERELQKFKKGKTNKKGKTKKGKTKKGKTNKKRKTVRRSRRSRRFRRFKGGVAIGDHVGYANGVRT